MFLEKLQLGSRAYWGRFDEVNARRAYKYTFALDFVRDKEVLDVGCAAGFGSHYLAARGQPREVVGVDISDQAIALARSRYDLSNLRFRRGDGVALPFDDNSFDVVCAFEIIEHVRNYQGLLEEARRVLRPDGVLLLSTPNKAITSPDTAKPVMPDHVKEFFADELRDLLGSYFEEVDLRGQSPTDPRYWAIVGGYLASRRFRFLKRLSQIELLRWLAAYIPATLKQLVTAAPRPWLTTSPLKIEVVSDPRGAITLLAVCRCP